MALVCRELICDAQMVAALDVDLVERSSLDRRGERRCSTLLVSGGRPASERVLLRYMCSALGSMWVVTQCG